MTALMDKAFRVTDGLLIEDVNETVEGLMLDLKYRGAITTRIGFVSAARDLLTQEEWSFVLFDLRLPHLEDEVPTLENGLTLLREYLSGKYGGRVPFAIVTNQRETPEIQDLRLSEYSEFMGFYEKRDDPRRLYAALESRGLLTASMFDAIVDPPEDRRRTKLKVIGVDGSTMKASVKALSWGDEQFTVDLTHLLPGLRREVLAQRVPFFLYCTVNANAAVSQELEPRDFSRIVPLIEHPLPGEPSSPG